MTFVLNSHESTNEMTVLFSLSLSFAHAHTSSVPNSELHCYALPVELRSRSDPGGGANVCHVTKIMVTSIDEIIVDNVASLALTADIRSSSPV